MNLTAVDTLIPAPEDGKDGDTGPQGPAGADAYTVQLLPRVVSVETDANGIVKNFGEQVVAATLWKGHTKVSAYTATLGTLPSGVSARVVGNSTTREKEVYIGTKFAAWKKDSAVVYTAYQYPNVQAGMPVFDADNREIQVVDSTGTVWIRTRAYVTYEGYTDGIRGTLTDTVLIPVTLTDTSTGVSKTDYIEVVPNKKGEKGDKGDDGLRAIPIPAGEYSSTQSYTATAYLAPYVLCEGKYYILNKTGTFTGINPKNDYAAHGQNATWLYLENVQYVFTEILMANLALLGKAVFYGNYMFSQYGKRGNTVINTPGNYSAPTEAGGDFTPNILINFMTGFFRCLDAEIKGTVNADAGYFGDMTISGAKFDSKTGKLNFGVNNNSYTYISTSTTELARNANLYLSNQEGGYGIYAHSNATALKLIGANAIDSDGAVTFRHTNTRFVMGANGLYFYVKHNNAEVEVFHLTADEMLIGNRASRLVFSASDTAGSLKVYTYNGSTWSLKKTL